MEKNKFQRGGGRKMIFEKIYTPVAKTSEFFTSSLIYFSLE